MQYFFFSIERKTLAAVFFVCFLQIGFVNNDIDVFIIYESVNHYQQSNSSELLYLH